MESLNNLHWKMIFVKYLELREALMMSYHMVRFLEELMYVLLLAPQMGRFLLNMGKLQWGGYLVQIVDLREVHPSGFQMLELREVPLLVS